MLRPMFIGLTSKSYMGKAVSGTLFFICILWAFAVNGKQTHGFKAEHVELIIPEGWYLGEVAGLEFLPSGEMVVFNRGAHPLLIFDTQGHFKRELGKELFSVPHGLFVDNQGYIWTTDQKTHQVLKFDQFGEIQLILGRRNSEGSGWYENGYQLNLFNAPSDVALDSKGNIYVADGGNYRIVKFDSHGAKISSWGTKGKRHGEFDFPHSLVIDEHDTLYVTDRQNGRIQLFDTQGEFKQSWDKVGYPYEIEQLSADRFVISDARSGNIVILDERGNPLSKHGRWGKKLAQFGFPHGLAIDKKGDIFVGELLNWRVQALRNVK